MQTQSSNQINVYLEAGTKRIIAGALEWPGWTRDGRDEQAALHALLEYAPRYARVLGQTQLLFRMPASVADFTVIERLEGNATTDFGVPGIAPASDSQPATETDLQRFRDVLMACWHAFDAAASAAAGKSLRTGPRGGGRDLEKITRHVLEADAGYLNQTGWKLSKAKEADLAEQLEHVRHAILDACAASARGELPTHGPRGGARWTARYFVRRVAYHVLDHAWEIEDRMV